MNNQDYLNVNRANHYNFQQTASPQSQGYNAYQNNRGNLFSQNNLQQLLSSLLNQLTSYYQQPQYNQTIVGSHGNDYLTSNPANNTMWGLGGNDTLVGGQGYDTLIGGNGHDYLIASDGDRAYGGNGFDYLQANTQGVSQLSGGNHYDIVQFNGRAQDYQMTPQGNGANISSRQFTHIPTGAITHVNNDVEQFNFTNGAYHVNHIDQVFTPTPQPLNLNPEQQANVQALFGLGSPPVSGVQVLDVDTNQKISAGDIAIINGGFTGGELGRKTLSQADVNQINNPFGGGDHAALQQQLNDNRAKWNALGAQNYDFTHQRISFSTPDFTRPVDVSVRNGEVTNAQYTDTGLPVVQGYGANSVDDLFNLIQGGIDGNAERIDVTFDPQTGAPTNLSIDQSTMIADEEFSITANNFRFF